MIDVPYGPKHHYYCTSSDCIWCAGMHAVKKEKSSIQNIICRYGIKIKIKIGYESLHIMEVHKMWTKFTSLATLRKHC